MPLICEPASILSSQPTALQEPRQSQQSEIAKQAIMASAGAQDDKKHSTNGAHNGGPVEQLEKALDKATTDGQRVSPPMPHSDFKRPALPVNRQPSLSQAFCDTPNTTAPNSPRFHPKRQNSGTSTPRPRPTTLDIPGLTKSKVSPDGRIASRDVGAKLVIVMVGLPARGKSYITKKLARYLNWLQHDTRIFNVGERRRVAAGGSVMSGALERIKEAEAGTPPHLALTPADLLNHRNLDRAFPSAASIMLNGQRAPSPPGTPRSSSHQRQPSDAGSDLGGLDSPARTLASPGKPDAIQMPAQDQMDQSASFFDPSNKKAALIREQCAMDTLDDLLDYILDGNGSVGILDATNSTLARRKTIMKRIRDRAGPELNVLFLESRCMDEQLLESNMRLKLSGPDYKDKDPIAALKDFKKRVAIYEKNYTPLGEYEEANDMPFIQIIDVGRKIISHQIKGFLMAQANYYLLNFNLAPRQIWITRHGLSVDNVNGKIGGDSDLAPEGELYAQTLSKFMAVQRHEWDVRQLHKLSHSHFPPQPGDTTPPNPYYQPNSLQNSQELSSSADEHDDCIPEIPQKPFCVWTSMLKRSIQTADYFGEEEFDVKQFKMLDELNAGIMEGLTYSSIASTYPDEYELRKRDKLHYRYPGPGGEGYLDIINRLRPIIVELERMTDHVLLVGHRSVARVLLAYFKGLKREEVADLDVPIGMLYCLEPKPYGVEFKAFRWSKEQEWFVEEPDFKLQRDEKDML